MRKGIPFKKNKDILQQKIVFFCRCFFIGWTPHFWMKKQLCHGCFCMASLPPPLGYRPIGKDFFGFHLKTRGNVQQFSFNKGLGRSIYWGTRHPSRFFFSACNDETNPFLRLDLDSDGRKRVEVKIWRLSSGLHQLGHIVSWKTRFSPCRLEVSSASVIDVEKSEFGAGENSVDFARWISRCESPPHHSECQSFEP